MTTAFVRAALAQAVGAEKAARAKVSGGPIQGFAGGWAKIPFRGSLGHFWRALPATSIHKNIDGRVLWIAACGLQGTTVPGRLSALQIGDWDHCKRCAKKHGAGPTDAERGT